MSEDQASPAFVAALANEQFILQSVSSTTVSESSSRAALYLSALSSGLVATGFASAAPEALPAFVFTIFPTVFLLGWFTVVRLIDTSVENVVALRRIETIREYWATLDPDGPSFFQPDSDRAHRGVRYGSRAYLFTTASLITVVNAVLGGATCALVAAVAWHLPTPAALAIGILTGSVFAAVGLAYERRRLDAQRPGTDPPRRPPLRR